MFSGIPFSVRKANMFYVDWFFSLQVKEFREKLYDNVSNIVVVRMVRSLQ